MDTAVEYSISHLGQYSIMTYMEASTTVTENGGKFHHAANPSRLAAIEARFAQLDHEERKVIVAKDTVKRRAEELRRYEEALRMKEDELRLRLSFLERRVQDLLVREAAVQMVSRNLGKA